MKSQRMKCQENGTAAIEIVFDDRVAVITGAGGGLGKTYALELARRGAKVVVNDLGGSRDGAGGAKSMADETVSEIEVGGGQAVANYDSVSTPEGGAAVIGTAVDAFGTVDIVINNAGILRDKSFANVDMADVHAVLDVHLRGAFHVTQPAFRVMKEKGYGRIVYTDIRIRSLRQLWPGQLWGGKDGIGRPDERHGCRGPQVRDPRQCHRSDRPHDE